jgi:hypothetical protein
MEGMSSASSLVCVVPTVNLRRSQTFNVSPDAYYTILRTNLATSYEDEHSFDDLRPEEKLLRLPGLQRATCSNSKEPKYPKDRRS